MPMPKPVRHQNNGSQSGTGTLLYQTEIRDAGGIDLDADAQLWPCKINKRPAKERISALSSRRMKPPAPPPLQYRKKKPQGNNLDINDLKVFV